MMAANRTLSYALLVAFVGMLLMYPELALADPFSAGAKSLKRDIIELLTPVIGLAIIGLGIACSMGKISWWWLGGAVVGTILVYGHEQIISWIRTAFGI